MEHQRGSEGWGQKGLARVNWRSNIRLQRPPRPTPPYNNDLMLFRTQTNGAISTRCCQIDSHCWCGQKDDAMNDRAA